MLERESYRLGESVLDTFANDHAVDHRFDIVVLTGFEFRDLLHFVGLAVDPHGATAKDDHGTSGSVPSTAAGHGEDELKDGHGDKAGAYMARGSVSVPSKGTWTARLSIRDAHGDEMIGETQVEVTEGGPNRLYLGFTGSLIFGSMLFGLIQRRRPSRLLSTTKD